MSQSPVAIRYTALCFLSDWLSFLLPSSKTHVDFQNSCVWNNGFGRWVSPLGTLLFLKAQHIKTMVAKFAFNTLLHAHGQTISPTFAITLFDNVGGVFTDDLVVDGGVTLDWSARDVSHPRPPLRLSPCQLPTIQWGDCFYLQLTTFLLTVEFFFLTVCLGAQTHIFPLQANKTSTLSKETRTVSRKTPTVSKEIPQNNCKQKLLICKQKCCILFHWVATSQWVQKRGREVEIRSWFLHRNRRQTHTILTETITSAKKSLDLGLSLSWMSKVKVKHNLRDLEFLFQVWPARYCCYWARPTWSLWKQMRKRTIWATFLPFHYESESKKSPDFHLWLFPWEWYPKSANLEEDIWTESGGPLSLPAPFCTFCIWIVDSCFLQCGFLQQHIFITWWWLPLHYEIWIQSDAAQRIEHIVLGVLWLLALFRIGVCLGWSLAWDESLAPRDLLL